MKSAEAAFLVGLFTGFLVTGLLMLITTVDPLNPLKKEAIKRGYAEMKLATPYDTVSVFTWKEGAK
jgi:hypothetical protein